ncbi:T9SS type A sorting domain-containing protein [Flavobacterium sp. LC2016-01]|uniref:T9SS type A sorting domain-containing protein n=1 Tax=Flavobacterium sp. LC2016-01 TaxID=2675876 RepID=UPI0012BA763C|nr:T9SS type A sorting domain-containing protein [Flavobacterium sp. LC2016-01]MTH15210.1 T9SS type A sorting domain-containing protein [Flavobacterium sp. LC2016-01]
MKKTLLCFLLLFTSFIYSQANDIVHCAGDNNFDLSKQKIYLIGNLDPDQTTVSYHLSLADAVNNTNAIANPSNYNTAAVSTTIYARINNNGTITTSSFNVKVTPAVNIIATNSPILCTGNTATLTVTVSGGSGQYFYSLNGAAFVSSNVFTNVAAGNHSIKVLDAVAGCSTTSIYTITAPTILSATTLISGNTATITATGGKAPYQYSLDGVNYQSNNIFTLSPGTYTIMVKDSLGCITAIQATILPALTVSSTFVNEFSCSRDMLTMAITATGGKAPYTYSLNGGPYQTNNSYSGIFAGNYIIAVKDALNTVSSKGIFIAPYLPLKLSLSTTNTSCYGTNDGTAQIIVSNGKAPYLYSIDNGPLVSTNVFSNLSPSYHTIYVKDATGCSIQSDIVIGMASPVEILESVTNAGLDNNDGQIKINATGGKAPYSYTLVDNVGTTLKGPQTSNVFSGLSAGSYQAQVTDSNGCFYTRSSIKVVQSTLAANLVVNAITCENPKGSITITATGGVPPYRYSLNDGAYSSVNVFNDLTPQTYTVKVRDAQNVRVSLSAIVTQSTPLTLSTAVNIPVNCNGASTGAIISTPSGGKSPYTYSLDGTAFQSSRYFLNLKAGTYNITTKDANNCIAVSSITLSEPSPLSATYEIVNDQNIFIYPKGGSNLYAFYLTNTTTGIQYGPETVGTFTKLPPGLYTIFVGDSNCDFTVSGIKIEASQSTALSAVSKVDPLGCLSYARITVDAMGGKTPYQYSINNGTTYSSSNIFTSLNAGTYTVKVRDADLNTTTHTVVINPLPSAPTIEAIVKNITCQGSKNGSITVKGSGGSGKYIYRLNGGVSQNFDTFSNLAPGSYTIEIQDMNICKSTMTVTITEPQALNVTAKIGLNQTITATATGGSAPYSYALENDNGVVIATPQSSNIFSNLTNGLYTLKVIDANACSVSVSNINMIPFTALSASVNATNITCSSPTGTIKINATGGIQPYQYSLDNGTYVSSNVFENLATKNYTVKVKDAQNTVLDFTTTVAQTTLLAVSANIEVGINCPGNTTGLIKATANGGAEPYEYSIDGTNFKSNRYFQNLGAGNYNITVKDYNGCLATTPTLILAEPSPISGTYKIVNEENIVLTGSGGDTDLYSYYLENTATGTKLGSDGTGRFTKLAVGTYNATISNSKGCSFQIPGIKIEASSSTNLSVATFSDPVTCTFKGRITILAKGGKAPYQYSLNNGETYSSSNIIVGLIPNYAYPIVVRDADLNTVTDQIIVENASSPPFSTAIVKHVSCPGNNDGIIKVIPTYEKGPLSYALDGVTMGNSDTFVNLKPGIYGITVYSQNSCWYYFTATVKDATPLTATVTLGTNNSITANVTGGSAPYSYALENENGVTVVTPQTSNTFTNLVAARYTLKVIDANKCNVSVSNINIIEVPKLAATATVTNVNCNASGAITVNATGGTGPYQYSIDGGINYSSSNIFAGLTAGNYITKVKDSQNTVFSLSLEITASTPLQLIATLTSQQTCSSPATIQATVTGGLAPYTYAVNGGIYSASNTFQVNGGTHVISVKDKNGCVENVSITVTDPTPIIANISIENQTATIIASGGTGGYLYAISPNLNVFSASNKFTNLTAGEYIIIVQDQIGCYVTFNFTINPPAPSLEGKNSITISFKPGQTLADVVVEGENIKWYSTSGSGTSKTIGKSNETPLPLTTVLLDGVTYYASQTINGIESKNRLAVTAKVNGSLSAPDFNLTAFQFYPNPVQDILTIKNNSIIDDVEIIDVSGKSVVFKKINDLQSEIDLSNLSSGVYLMKVKSEGREKTIKIIKK